MKPNKHEISYRKHLANEKRLREVEEQLKTLPLRKLPEPILKGWEIYYELRDDIKRRKDAFDIQQVLDIGFGTSYTRNVKHVRAIRRGDKGYTLTINGKREWVTFCPPRRTLSEKEYEALPQPVKKYFSLDTTLKSYIDFGRKWYMPSIPYYWVILKAKADIHTHYRERGGKLEQERDFLQDQTRMYWFLNTGGYSKSYPKSKARTQTRDQIKKFLKGEIEDIENHKIPKEYEY